MARQLPPLPADAEGLVRYGQWPEVVEVREFLVSAALIEGLHELLATPVPSQWGHVHIFDLCMLFRLYDLAWALACRGVQGCRVTRRYLDESMGVAGCFGRACRFGGG